MLKKILWVVGALVAAFVGVLAALYVHDLATGGSFKDAEWAAAGAWVGGIATSLAVAVALLQAWLARGEAKKSRKDAEKLLSKELDAQRRDRQVEAVAEVWEGIAEMLGPVQQLTAHMERLTHCRNLMQNCASQNEFNEALKMSRAAASDFIEWFPTFESIIARAEISFTRALMIVDEPNSLNMVEDAYQAFIDFRGSIAEVAKAGAANQPYDLDSIKKYKSALITKRDPMVKAVRKHLAESRPLRAFRQTLPAEEEESQV